MLHTLKAEPDLVIPRAEIGFGPSYSDPALASLQPEHEVTCPNLARQAAETTSQRMDTSHTSWSERHTTFCVYRQLGSSGFATLPELASAPQRGVVLHECLNASTLK